MKQIQNILVATDFSVTSRNAYRYARNLASSLGAALTIIHVKENLIMTSDVMITSFPPEDGTELIMEIRQLMSEEDAITGKESSQKEVKIEIITGDPVQVLTELSQSDNTDLIVIGTTGLADVLTKIFGSTSIKVSNKAHCPVIIVPRDAPWQPIEQIVFASNYESMKSEQVNNITDFATHINADVHFINVKSYDPVLENKQKETNWEELFGSNHSDLNFEKHTIYGNDTIEQLQKYSEEKGIDLLAFVSMHRNFWENIMHKSVTENMALSSIIPIMVMHFDDEK